MIFSHTTLVRRITLELVFRFPKVFILADRTYIVRYLLHRDGHYCCLCGNKLSLTAKGNTPECVSVDHIVPIDKGGDPLDLDNLQLTHVICNMAKNNNSTEDFHRQLYWEHPEIVRIRRMTRGIRYKDKFE